MDARIRKARHTQRTLRSPLRLMRSLLAAALLLAGSAHAATVYRCAGASGHDVFQDRPCPVHTAQTRLDIAGQPLIDRNTPHTILTSDADTHRTARVRRPPTQHHARPRAEATSWECRAADGEVFYRHTHCPGSIPGDGVARDDFATGDAPSYGRGRHNAWSRVRVRATKVPRSEACARIHAIAASGRDGHQRDADVSTYDHLVGRDPCAGR